MIVKWSLLMLTTLAVGPPVVVAQEAEKPTYPPRTWPGLLLEAGEWVSPTPSTALQIILASEATDEDADLGYEAAAAVLRQTFEGRSSGELDAFADQLVQVIIEGDEHQSLLAQSALLVAGADDPEPGTRYMGAAAAFIRLYETFDQVGTWEARRAPLAMWIVGERHYVYGLFAEAEKPPACQGHRSSLPCDNRSTWCDAGYILLSHNTGVINRHDFALRCAFGAR